MLNGQMSCPAGVIELACLARQGRDHTLFALEPGYVTFSYDKKRDRRFISIDPCESPRGPTPAERRPTHVPRRSQRDSWAQHPAQGPWLEQRQRISHELHAAVGASMT